MSPAAPTLLRADASLEDLLTAAECLSGGQVLRVPFSSASSSTSLREHLLLCGLECIRIDKTNNFIEGVQPESVGQSVSLSYRPKEAEAEAEDDEELIDEAELLSRDGLVVKAPAANGLGCADAPGGGRQPCKGCSCGLADRVAPEEDGKVDTKGAEKSNCGSCALGDAFRCAGCPYLGLPPFKPGEKVALPLSLMTSDI